MRSSKPKTYLTFGLLALAVLFTGTLCLVAQPAITSTVPANGATGVSTNGPVVFTFSKAMNTNSSTTSVEFFDETASALATVTSVWSVGNTVLTCTPSPAFGANHLILWVVGGQDTSGNSLAGNPEGTFTTVTNGGGTTSGNSNTNTLTSFVVGKAWEYLQTSAAAPTLNTNIPYVFDALTTLTSNRTANTVTVTFPNSTISNLVQNPVSPWNFLLSGYNTNLTAYNAAFPSGNYTFNVSATASNQQVTVNMPAYSQPNAPQVSNYDAAQSINPSQPFTLTWNAFNGGASTDIVFVVIGNVFTTGFFTQTNALPGTATSVTIPAGALPANSNFTATVGFYHAGVGPTNAGYVTEAFVESVTQFQVSTGAATTTNAPAPEVANVSWSAGTFGFDILTTPNQTVTVVYTNILSRASTAWPILLTTNSPGGKVHISVPTAGAKTFFYRARNGS